MSAPYTFQHCSKLGNAWKQSRSMTSKACTEPILFIGEGDVIPAPALFCQIRDALLLLLEVLVGGQQRGMPRHDL